MIDQTQRRVFHDENVPSSEKIVSLFEAHTDIIVKSSGDTLYSHKINVSSDSKGFITYLAIEDGNPNDADRFMPIIHGHVETFGKVPASTVRDGCYASLVNVYEARAFGIERVVFHKKRRLFFADMGVKKKTFDRL